MDFCAASESIFINLTIVFVTVTSYAQKCIHNKDPTIFWQDVTIEQFIASVVNIHPGPNTPAHPFTAMYIQTYTHR